MGASAQNAALVLEDGTLFVGRAFGATGVSLGEAVFCTGMTGYQETLTDPSYHGQIVVQTASHIGNTGWTAEDDESSRIQVAGYVLRELSRRPSNWRSRHSLGEELERQGIVGVSGIDTRALTLHLRTRGAMRAGVFSGDAFGDRAEMTAQVLAAPPMAGAALAVRVGTVKPYVV
ncbi:carbamoyl-phosphate synthase domain-containing protein, partial [Streptacidiphilus neutrinimicus]|uniref:carbamoyl-phosphate synthase domain-containing protein n=1 Tax=Streptacidiphilus neutrinimicus TaxID=105420 RepID=UPI0005AB7668